MDTYWSDAIATTLSGDTFWSLSDGIFLLEGMDYICDNPDIEQTIIDETNRVNEQLSLSQEQKLADRRCGIRAIARVVVKSPDMSESSLNDYIRRTGLPSVMANYFGKKQAFIVYAASDCSDSSLYERYFQFDTEFRCQLYKIALLFHQGQLNHGALEASQINISASEINVCYKIN